MERECEHLLSYMADTFDQTSKRKFEAHLNHCDTCQKEYHALLVSWNALQFDFVEQDIPQSLKADVFDFVFKNDKKAEKQVGKNSIKKWGLMIKKQFTPLSTVLVVIMLAVTAVLTYTTVQTPSQRSPVQPAEILATINLTSATEQFHEAGGYAYVVKQAHKKTLVVHVQGLPKLEGSKTYQVWLLKDGKRQNAGMFNTNETGAGVLAYEIPEDHSFDKIGITMEPDHNNVQPEGKKVVGS